MPKLLLKFRDNVIQEIPINKPCTTVGRVPENDIVINNLGVSRLHAKIIQEGEDFFLEDMESRNATFLNSQEVKKSKLKDKDEIGIGKHTLVFLAHEEVSANAAAQASKIVVGGPASHMSPEETVQLAASMPTKKYTPGHKDHGADVHTIKEAGVDIVEGAVNQNSVKFERVLTVAGKGPTVDIRIKGTYEKDVVFVISNRPTGFFISPPKGISLKVNGQDVKDYILLEDGALIEAGETKMKFFIRTKEKK